MELHYATKIICIVQLNFNFELNLGSNASAQLRSDSFVINTNPDLAVILGQNGDMAQRLIGWGIHAD